MKQFSKLCVGAAVSTLLCGAANATPLSHFTTIFDTDFVSAAIGGMRGDSGNASLNLSGVSGSVSRAFLYWHGPSNITATPETANANVSFAGTNITGTFLGISSDNCWGFANSVAYRADVTSLVTGNGNYALANFVKPNVQINGASLIVFYNDGNSANNRDVVMFDGNDSNQPNAFDALGWNISLSGINYSSGTANAQFHVADGQTFPDDVVRANGVDISGPNAFNGVFAQDAGESNTPGNGLLYDVRDFDVTSLLSPGANTLNITSGTVSDCLACLLIAVDLPAGAAPPIPGTVPVPGSLALLGIGLLGLAGLRRKLPC